MPERKVIHLKEYTENQTPDTQKQNSCKDIGKKLMISAELLYSVSKYWVHFCDTVSNTVESFKKDVSRINEKYEDDLK